MVFIVLFLLQLVHLREKKKIPVYQLLFIDYKLYPLWCFHLTYAIRKVFVLLHLNIIFKRLMEPLHEVCPLEIPATDFVRDFFETC